MVNVSTLAAGKNAVVGNLRHVQHQSLLLDCADIDKGLFTPSNLSALAANDVYAVMRIPANSKLISFGARVLKAEGAVTTAAIAWKTTAFGAIATLDAALDLNDAGDEGFWATGDYSDSESFITITPSAEANLAQVHIDVQYVTFVHDIAEVA